jgi:hypothetical protein
MKIYQLIFAFVFLALLVRVEAQPPAFKKRQEIKQNTKLIAKMIGAIQPELKKSYRYRIARSLYSVASKYQIDPKLMIAIIGTESEFSNSRISSTGDLSLAQINPVVWNKEFARLGFEKLNNTRLKKDETYALKKMAEILNILKHRHSKNDKNWYARYHSHTQKYKRQYQSKVQLRMKMIASIH